MLVYDLSCGLGLVSLVWVLVAALPDCLWFGCYLWWICAVLVMVVVVGCWWLWFSIIWLLFDASGVSLLVVDRFRCCLLCFG